MTQPHNYPHVLQWIAEGKFNKITFRRMGKNDLRMFSNVQPESLQAFLENSWEGSYVFKLIPEMMRINGHEVPEPERQAPTKGTEIYIPNLLTPESCTSFTWSPDSTMCKLFLNRGVVHLNKEAAIAHTRALLSFTEVKHEKN